MQTDALPRRHPGGRPRADDPRATKMTVSLTAGEADAFTRQVRAAGMNRSEAIRLLLINADLPAARKTGIDPGASDAYAKLQPLQSNLNQIASWLNKTRPVDLSRSDLETIQKNVAVTYRLVATLRQEILGIAGAQ